MRGIMRNGWGPPMGDGALPVICHEGGTVYWYQWVYTSSYSFGSEGLLHEW